MPACRKHYCIVTVHVEKETLEHLDWLVKEGWFMTRTQAIQFAIYLLILRYRNIFDIE